MDMFFKHEYQDRYYNTLCTSQALSFQLVKQDGGKMINKYYLKYPILHDVGKMTNLKIPLYAQDVNVKCVSCLTAQLQFLFHLFEFDLMRNLQSFLHPLNFISHTTIVDFLFIYVLHATIDIEFFYSNHNHLYQKRFTEDLT